MTKRKNRKSWLSGLSRMQKNAIRNEYLVPLIYEWLKEHGPSTARNMWENMVIEGTPIYEWKSPRLGVTQNLHVRSPLALSQILKSHGRHFDKEDNSRGAIWRVRP